MGFWAIGGGWRGFIEDPENLFCFGGIFSSTKGSSSLSSIYYCRVSVAAIVRTGGLVFVTEVFFSLLKDYLERLFLFCDVLPI